MHSRKEPREIINYPRPLSTLAKTTTGDPHMIRQSPCIPVEKECTATAHSSQSCCESKTGGNVEHMSTGASAVSRPRGLPQSAEREIVLSAKPYVPGLLDLAAGPCLPLVKPAGVYQASLFALPGVAVRRLARHLLGARIGGAVLGHFAPRPHRYEGPDGVLADELAAAPVDDRHAGADVVARFETARSVARANDLEGVHPRPGIGDDVESSAHGALPAGIRI